MRGPVVALAWLMAACKDEPTGDETGTIPIDLSACESNDTPEVFLGRGVGGAFDLLAPDEALGLTAAPQGGFGVSVLVGTRGLQAGSDEVVSAELTADSSAVENSGATFTLDAVLDCKSDGPDGPQGIIYGVVVGFASSLSNTNLLEMNGQPANLTVSVTDAVGNVGMVEQTVTLIVGE